MAQWILHNEKGNIQTSQLTFHIIMNGLVNVKLIKRDCKQSTYSQRSKQQNWRITSDHILKAKSRRIQGEHLFIYLLSYDTSWGHQSQCAAHSLTEHRDFCRLGM